MSFRGRGFYYRAPMRAPRPQWQPAKMGKRPQKKKPSGDRPQAVVTYGDRNLLQLTAMNPVQLGVTLTNLLGTQAKQAPDWWSEFKIVQTEYSIVRINDAKSTIVFDHFVNQDAYIPANSAEFLREQGRKTAVYVPQRTGRIGLGKFAPKYDVTGSANQFTNINKVDVKNGADTNWVGLCLMSDTNVTIEYDVKATVHFYGAH